jgi:cellulose synthase/poly-beta-1,6-N-acetylglucosamine synthase-like glycosyltransferase
MSKLNYPKDKLEILIGDDASSDRTLPLVQHYIKDKPNFKVFLITKVIGKGRGKANVLGQLAHKAEGEFYFITDVDVELPKDWLLGLLQEFEDGVGIISGTTMCERGHFFATMQSIDWLHFMGYIKAFANVGIGCTSVGNNMAVRAEAYWQTGGYENIDFSITEEYKLFQSVTSRNWEWRTILSDYSLGKAWYISNVREMLHQRKRWLIGARDLPFNWKAMIFLYGLFLPTLFILLMLFPQYAMVVWFSKFIIQSMFITILCVKTKVRPFKFWELMIYEFYVVGNTIATAVFYFLPVQSVWKGRKYAVSYIQDGIE